MAATQRAEAGLEHTQKAVSLHPDRLRRGPEPRGHISGALQKPICICSPKVCRQLGTAYFSRCSVQYRIMR